MAGDRGFEPRLTDPESVVLPLDESPAVDSIHIAQHIIAIGQFRGNAGRAHGTVPRQLAAGLVPMQLASRIRSYRCLRRSNITAKVAAGTSFDWLRTNVFSLVGEHVEPL